MSAVIGGGSSTEEEKVARGRDHDLRRALAAHGLMHALKTLAAATPLLVDALNERGALPPVSALEHTERVLRILDDARHDVMEALGDLAQIANDFGVRR